jgi:signal transduction histidine kinase
MMNAKVSKLLIAVLCLALLLSLPANLEIFQQSRSLLRSGIIVLVFFLSAIAVIYLAWLLLRPGHPSENLGRFKKRNRQLELLLVEKDAELTDIKNLLQQDINAIRDSEMQSREVKQHLLKLSARLESIREEERTRISREIHDELGQQLTGLKMDIAWLNKRMKERPELGEKLQSMLSLVDDTIHSVRRISTELRPGILDDLGLIPAVEWQCSECEKRNGIECNFRAEVEEDAEFPPPVSTAVFRIVQEALTNVVRHSEATVIDVEMRTDEENLVVAIQDNGRGITGSEITNTTSLGLLGIRERAELLGGECSITGRKDKGTLIMLNIPLAA